MIKIGTWNVRSLTHKEQELCEELENNQIQIAVITETKKKLKGTNELKNYIMLYSGVNQEERAAAGVAILINNQIKDRIRSYKIVNSRIIVLRISVDRGYLTIIGVYAPEEGRTEESEKFYLELQKVISSINKND